MIPYSKLTKVVPWALLVVSSMDNIDVDEVPISNSYGSSSSSTDTGVFSSSYSSSSSSNKATRREVSEAARQDASDSNGKKRFGIYDSEGNLLATDEDLEKDHHKIVLERFLYGEAQLKRKKSSQRNKSAKRKQKSNGETNEEMFSNMPELSGRVKHKELYLRYLDPEDDRPDTLISKNSLKELESTNQIHRISVKDIRRDKLQSIDSILDHIGNDGSHSNNPSNDDQDSPNSSEDQRQTNTAFYRSSPWKTVSDFSGTIIRRDQWSAPRPIDPKEIEEIRNSRKGKTQGVVTNSRSEESSFYTSEDPSIIHGVEKVNKVEKKKREQKAKKKRSSRSSDAPVEFEISPKGELKEITTSTTTTTMEIVDIEWHEDSEINEFGVDEIGVPNYETIPTGLSKEHREKLLSEREAFLEQKRKLNTRLIGKSATESSAGRNENSAGTLTKVRDLSEKYSEENLRRAKEIEGEIEGYHGKEKEIVKNTSKVISYPGGYYANKKPNGEKADALAEATKTRKRMDSKTISFITSDKKINRTKDKSIERQENNTKKRENRKRRVTRAGRKSTVKKKKAGFKIGPVTVVPGKQNHDDDEGVILHGNQRRMITYIDHHGEEIEEEEDLLLFSKTNIYSEKKLLDKDTFLEKDAFLEAYVDSKRFGSRDFEREMTMIRAEKWSEQLALAQNKKRKLFSEELARQMSGRKEAVSRADIDVVTRRVNEQEKLLKAAEGSRYWIIGRIEEFNDVDDVRIAEGGGDPVRRGEKLLYHPSYPKSFYDFLQRTRRSLRRIIKSEHPVDPKKIGLAHTTSSNRRHSRRHGRISSYQKEEFGLLVESSRVDSCLKEDTLDDDYGATESCKDNYYYDVTDSLHAIDIPRLGNERLWRKRLPFIRKLVARYIYHVDRGDLEEIVTELVRSRNQEIAEELDKRQTEQRRLLFETHIPEEGKDEGMILRLVPREVNNQLSEDATSDLSGLEENAKTLLSSLPDPENLRNLLYNNHLTSDQRADFALKGDHREESVTKQNMKTPYIEDYSPSALQTAPLEHLTLEHVKILADMGTIKAPSSSTAISSSTKISRQQSGIIPRLLSNHTGGASGTSSGTTSIPGTNNVTVTTIFLGQSAQCVVWHETHIFGKSMVTLWGGSMKTMVDCLSLHYKMDPTKPYLNVPGCQVKNVCELTERMYAEMQLMENNPLNNPQCACELCTWGSSWLAPGNSDAKGCPNSLADAMRTWCAECSKLDQKELDLALLSDAHIPKRHRFEKINLKGECVSEKLAYVRGLAAVVGSHEKCRDTCWETVGLECLGYTYFACSRRCVVHTTLDGLKLLPHTSKEALWTPVRGEGAGIANTDNSCGSQCFRVTYGICPPGGLNSNQVNVTWDSQMVYGQSRIFNCPKPFSGEVTITCLGANAQRLNGVCLEPCPAGRYEVTPGTLVPYPPIAIQSRYPLSCPFANNGDIELWCQSDGSIVPVTTLCGEPCSSGNYALPLGTGNIPYSAMYHLEVRQPYPCPFGYTGSLQIQCVDKVITPKDIPGSACYLHCASNATIPLTPVGCGNRPKSHPCHTMNLFTAFDLSNDAKWLNHPARLDQTEQNSGGVTIKQGTFFQHTSEIEVECDPRPTIYGKVKLGCNNGQIDTLENNCRYHCPPGSIEVGTNGHSLLMQYPLIKDFHEISIACPSAQWSGSVHLQCVNGIVSKKGEPPPTVVTGFVTTTTTLAPNAPPTTTGDPTIPESVCYRHCDINTIVSNGLNIPFTHTLKHDDHTTLDCALANDPGFAGILTLNCTNGEVKVTNYCGRFCPSTMVVSNNAMVLTVRQEHDQSKGYICPSPWSGVLNLRCDDTKIIQETSCGMVCPEGTHLVRGTVQMTYPSIADKNAGMSNGIPHGTDYLLGCPDLPPGDPRSFSQDNPIILSCNNGIVKEKQGFCWENCKNMEFTSNGYPQQIDFIAHGTNKTFTCAGGLETGYIVLSCYDGALTLLDGSCAAQGCVAGKYSGTATNFIDVDHPLIFHLGFTDNPPLKCPAPLTGELILACANLAVSVKEADCGNVCNINGTQLELSIDNRMTGFPIYGGIRMYTPAMDHSESVTLTCPGNTRGDITLTCRNGAPQITGGGCNNPCTPGSFLTPTGALVTVGQNLLHNQTISNFACPPGLTQGGFINITCNNGTFERSGGQCMTNCGGQSFESNGVSIQHPAIAHGNNLQIFCSAWNSGYDGVLDISCNAGSLKITGECKAHCQAGTVVSNGAIVPYELITHGTVVDYECSLANVGSAYYSHTLELSCKDGDVTVLSGTCKRDCDGTTKLFKKVFDHGLFKDNTVVTLPCNGNDPAQGLLNLLCTDGKVVPYESKCDQSCPPGEYDDTTRLKVVEGGTTSIANQVVTTQPPSPLPQIIKVTWSEPINSGQSVQAICDTTVASGTATIECTDGDVRLVPPSNCRLNCLAGTIEQPDPEGLLSVPILLKHGALKHDETETLICPEEHPGRAIAICDDGVVSIQSGSCGTSNCVANSAVAGENLLLSYPQLNHGDTHDVLCGEKFIGKVRFMCFSGVALRQWIRMYVLDFDERPDIVELCECCLESGLSSLTEGDGKLELGSSGGAIGGAWFGIAAAAFGAMVGVGYLFRDKIVKYVLPKDSWIMRKIAEIRMQQEIKRKRELASRLSQSKKENAPKSNIADRFIAEAEDGKGVVNVSEVMKATFHRAQKNQSGFGDFDFDQENTGNNSGGFDMDQNQTIYGGSGNNNDGFFEEGPDLIPEFQEDGYGARGYDTKVAPG